ncbi:unnamed protein product [Musa textilis]
MRAAMDFAMDITSNALAISGKVHNKVHNLKNWLSGAMAYQQTCIDDFPEGELKFKMRAAMDFAMDITSNALAISGKISSFLNLIQATSFSRRLLEAEPSEPGRYVDGNPSWVSHGDRRLLETPATLQFTPNASVAKDGNGNFTTISETVAQEGVYNEYMEVDAHTWNLTMYGDGPDKTIVTGSKNYVDGVRTFKSATFATVSFTATASSAAPSTSSSATPPPPPPSSRSAS